MEYLYQWQFRGKTIEEAVSDQLPQKIEFSSFGMDDIDPHSTLADQNKRLDELRILLESKYAHVYITELECVPHMCVDEPKIKKPAAEQEERKD